MLKRISISEKLFLYFLSLCLVSIIVVSSYSYYSARRALLARTFDQLITVRVGKTKNIERFFQDRERDIRLLSRSEVIAGMLTMMQQREVNDSSLRNTFDKNLEPYLRSNGYYKNLILVSAKGTLLWIPTETKEPRTPDLSLAGFAERLKHSQGPLLQDYTTDGKGMPRLFTGIPVPDPDNPGNVLILEISIDAINSIMFENNEHDGLGKTGESYLVGRDLLMRTSSRFQENSLFRTKVNTIATQKAFSGITDIQLIHDYRNKEVLSSYGRINVPGLDWMIAAEIDTSEAMIPVRNFRNSILLLSLIVSLLLFGIVSIISHRISSPIILLKKAAANIAEGLYSVRLRVTSHDEIGALTDAFNRMSEKLEEQSAQIRTERMKRMSSMIDGQEMERRRLSRDLHDGLGQSLLAVRMKLEQARSTDPEKTALAIETTGEMLKSAIGEIREISSNLMPPVLEAFGLEQGLENLCRSTSANSGIHFTFEKNIQTPFTDPRQQIYLYRIAQEAFNNITKHSGATGVITRLEKDQEQILLEISDNGKGFTSEIPQAGNGLTNIRERTELLGGNCVIRSAPGEGTHIILRIPLS